MKSKIIPSLLSGLLYLFVFNFCVYHLYIGTFKTPDQIGPILLVLITLGFLLVCGILVLFFFEKISLLTISSILSCVQYLIFIFIKLLNFFDVKELPKQFLKELFYSAPLYLLIFYIGFAIDFSKKRKAEKKAYVPSNNIDENVAFNYKIDRLNEMKRLQSENLISESEAKQIKDIILAHAEFFSIDDEKIEKLRIIKGLHDDGTLNDTDYLLEKSDILKIPLYADKQTPEKNNEQDNSDKDLIIAFFAITTLVLLAVVIMSRCQ